MGGNRDALKRPFWVLSYQGAHGLSASWRYHRINVKKSPAVQRGRWSGAGHLAAQELRNQKRSRPDTPTFRTRDVFRHFSMRESCRCLSREICTRFAFPAECKLPRLGGTGKGTPLLQAWMGTTEQGKGGCLGLNCEYVHTSKPNIDDYSVYDFQPIALLQWNDGRQEGNWRQYLAMTFIKL